MKLNTKNFQDRIKQNQELFFVVFLVLISVLMTQVFEFSKEKRSKEYIKLINNLYFQKTFNNIFQGFQPKYSNIEHKIKQNANFIFKISYGLVNYLFVIIGV